MRILILTLALCFPAVAFSATEADVIKDMRRLRPPVRLEHRLEAFGGVLLGFNGGEWGGALVFLDQEGRATRVNGDNITGMAKAGGRILVFEGLAHLTLNSGSILELTWDGTNPPGSHQLMMLEGEPSAVRQVDDQTVAFLVFIGIDRNGKSSYRCKLFTGGVVSDDASCAASEGQQGRPHAVSLLPLPSNR